MTAKNPCNGGASIFTLRHLHTHTHTRGKSSRDTVEDWVTSFGLLQ